MSVTMTEGARAPARSLLGFWELATFRPDGLWVSGWAARATDGAAPEAFELQWGGRIRRLAPNRERPDVARHREIAVAQHGFQHLVPIDLDPHADWDRPEIVAVWEDGSRLSLPGLRDKLDAHLGVIGFTSFEQFDRGFQNPAHRIDSPRLQAYGAARAMRIAGDDEMFWLAGAVVGLYRCILDGVFDRVEAERALAHWKRMQGRLRGSARGAMLRWATSMHLAAGYAHLAWGQHDAALEEFGAMADYTDRLATWPQSLTNLGIGRFIAAWLEYRRGDPAAALGRLAGSEGLFQAGVAPLTIWNWHMYEELGGALRACQMCFAFQKRLEGETPPHIVPPGFRLDLKRISAVLRLLIERGLVQDEALPGGT